MISWYPFRVLTLKEDKSTDYQINRTRDEEWIVVEGTGSYVLGEEELQFMEGDILFIPSGTPHRLRADRETVILNIASGWLEDEETVKLKDDYGRI